MCHSSKDGWISMDFPCSRICFQEQHEKVQHQNRKNPWKSSPSKSTRKKSPIHLFQAPTLPSKSGHVSRTPTPCNAQRPALKPRRTLNGPGVQPARSQLPREWPLKSLGVSEKSWWNWSFGEIAVRTSMSSIVWGTWRVRSLRGESTNFRLKPTVCFSWRMTIWGKIPWKIHFFSSGLRGFQAHGLSFAACRQRLGERKSPHWTQFFTFKAPLKGVTLW